MCKVNLLKLFDSFCVDLMCIIIIITHSETREGTFYLNARWIPEGSDVVVVERLERSLQILFSRVETDN